MRLGKASGPLIRQMHLAKHEQCVLINDLANPGFGLGALKDWVLEGPLGIT